MYVQGFRRIDRRTSAPTPGHGGFAGLAPAQIVDALSHEEEAELEVLRFEAARLREEGLRDATSRESLERKVDLLHREYKQALREKARLEKELRATRPQGAENGDQEQALVSAKRLLASLLASSQLAEVRKDPRPEDFGSWRRPVQLHLSQRAVSHIMPS